MDMGIGAWVEVLAPGKKTPIISLFKIKPVHPALFLYEW